MKNRKNSGERSKVARVVIAIFVILIILAMVLVMVIAPVLAETEGTEGKPAAVAEEAAASAGPAAVPAAPAGPAAAGPAALTTPDARLIQVDLIFSPDELPDEDPDTNPEDEPVEQQWTTDLYGPRVPVKLTMEEKDIGSGSGEALEEEHEGIHEIAFEHLSPCVYSDDYLILEYPEISPDGTIELELPDGIYHWYFLSYTDGIYYIDEEGGELDIGKTGINRELTFTIEDGQISGQTSILYGLSPIELNESLGYTDDNDSYYGDPDEDEEDDKPASSWGNSENSSTNFWEEPDVKSEIIEFLSERVLGIIVVIGLILSLSSRKKKRRAAEQSRQEQMRRSSGQASYPGTAAAPSWSAADQKGSFNASGSQKAPQPWQAGSSRTSQMRPAAGQKAFQPMKPAGGKAGTANKAGKAGKRSKYESVGQTGHAAYRGPSFDAGHYVDAGRAPASFDVGGKREKQYTGFDR